MKPFARWLVKHRTLVVLICLVLLIPSVLGMAATKVKYDLLYYLPEDLDTVKGQEILMEDFGKGAFSFCITEGMTEVEQADLEFLHPSNCSGAVLFPVRRGEYRILQDPLKKFSENSRQPQGSVLLPPILGSPVFPEVVCRLV